MQRSMILLITAFFCLISVAATAQDAAISYTDTYGRASAPRNPMGDMFVGMNLGTDYSFGARDLFDGVPTAPYAQREDIFNYVKSKDFYQSADIFAYRYTAPSIPADPLFHYEQ
jgi:hypothetical protein